MAKIKTDWNLKLLYKGDNDPKLEKDLRAIEKAHTNFEKKYRGKDFVSTQEKLKKALADKEKLSAVWENKNPWWYFALRTKINSDDKVAGAKSTQFNERIAKSTNKVKFFNIEIGKITKQKQNEYLKNPDLASYRYVLERIFESAKYKLTEEEEQLKDLLSLPARSMWINGQSKTLNGKTVKYKGKEIPLSEALSISSDQSKKDRRTLAGLITEVYKNMASFTESELNAVYTYKKIMDERRGYGKPYSSTALSHGTSEKIIENLQKVVTDNFKISHRFYKLHAKLLKEDKLSYEDRQVKIGKINRKFKFEDSVEILKNTFGRFDEKYSKMFNEFLTQGRIDVYPKKGKGSGAFHWSAGADMPSYVLLNHVDNLSSLETLAHEMGHSFHSVLANTQPVRYRGYSTATAEVASTFFEQLALEDVEKLLSPKEQIILLHQRILGDVSTIFRQIACFNFELDLHNMVRERGLVSKGDIADLLTKHMQAYLGPAFKVKHEDGYQLVSWSHIRNNFYVYTYAFGQLVSRALYEKWKEDHGYSEKVEQFLKAGESASPQDIFKSIGVDVTDPKFFELGLKSIGKDIIRLEKLTADYKK